MNWNKTESKLDRGAKSFSNLSTFPNGKPQCATKSNHFIQNGKHHVKIIKQYYFTYQTVWTVKSNQLSIIVRLLKP